MGKTATSIPKIFGGFGLTIFLNLIWGFLTYKVLFESKLKPFQISTCTEGYDWLLLTFILALELLFLRLLIKDNRLIIITSEKIIFISWILPILFKIKKKTFYDGYTLVGETDNYGNQYQAMYLIHNGKLIDRISSFYYQNFYQLISCSELKKLRKRKVGLIKQLIINIFGIPIKH
ncbi:hypothetical protein [Marinifilum caeruleilacunae]|uniref:Uncharacterized protein n=1 Tax=Marinifilum caeruleilacunae TaxID=2499076 RepID=A0ABX1X2M1_9BACT|nr:hypothetical protein [Marinifilum caeruleilacunae]NOU62333.1 hypothetical protein [Marinifilum caeruleilacunae]